MSSNEVIGALLSSLRLLRRFVELLSFSQRAQNDTLKCSPFLYSREDVRAIEVNHVSEQENLAVFCFSHEVATVKDPKVASTKRSLLRDHHVTFLIVSRRKLWWFGIESVWNVRLDHANKVVCYCKLG